MPCQGVRVASPSLGRGNVKSVKNRLRFQEGLVEPVADAAHALDESRVLRVDLQLPPQRRHVRIHRAIRHIDLRAPDPIEELVSRNDLPGSMKQQRQDLELRARQRHVGAVPLHMQGTPETMQDDPQYEDVVDDVTDGLRLAAAAAVAAGVARDRVCIDPGIGFGKALDHNMSLLNELGRIAQLGFPVLVGTSRKGFLGSILENAGHPADAGERDAATGATVALAIAHGASVVRVHNVVDALQSARTADAIVRSGQH